MSRLMFLEADETAQGLANATLSFKIHVFNHVPEISMGVEFPRTRLNHHSETGTWFAIPPKSLLFLFVAGIEFYPPNPMGKDEFPEEKDTRPHYHLPKNWLYGRALVVMSSFFDEVRGWMYIRAREKRI